MADWLKVALPEKLKPRSPLDYFLDEPPKTSMVEVNIPEDSKVIGKKILDVGFPKSAIIAMLRRKGKYLTPNGQTEIEANDQLLVLAENKKSIEDVFQSLHLPVPDMSDD